MIYKLTTNTASYFFKINEDGSLNITKWGEAYPFAGKLIQDMGGINELMKKSKKTDYVSFEQIKQERKTALQKAKEDQIKSTAVLREKITEKYNELTSLGVIPSTPENIRTVLKYLNTMNWGLWELPKMSIGYSCHQYDCEGHIVSTMTLDCPIEYCGMMVNKFKHGNAPLGHLMNYTSI